MLFFSYLIIFKLIKSLHILIFFSKNTLEMLGFKKKKKLIRNFLCKLKDHFCTWIAAGPTWPCASHSTCLTGGYDVVRFTCQNLESQWKTWWKNQCELDTYKIYTLFLEM
jgi:hypothetical protein